MTTSSASPDAAAPSPDAAAPSPVARTGFFDRRLRAAVLRAADRRLAERVAFVLPDGARHEVGPAGGRCVATVRVHRDAFFRKLVRRGRMGLGEAFVDGDLEADDLVAFLLAGARAGAAGRPGLLGRLREAFAPRRSENGPEAAQRHIRAHYDLGNAFFAAWLDPSMTYSSAQFASEAETLEAGQARKLATIATKAGIRPGDHVLEIGCGWGSFALYAARALGCRVTGITLSPAQLEEATRRVRAAGLDDRVELRLADWRDVTGRFDRIVSIEMLEALGRAGWEPWFQAIDRLLAPGGRAAIQGICWNAPDFEGYARRRDWIETYVFPGSLLGHRETFDRILAARTRLRVVDAEDLGPSYARTLALWRARFLAAWPSLRGRDFDERFRRTWEYYLSVCEAGFRAGRLSNLQLVLARDPDGGSTP